MCSSVHPGACDVRSITRLGVSEVGLPLLASFSIPVVRVSSIEEKEEKNRSDWCTTIDGCQKCPIKDEKKKKKIVKNIKIHDRFQWTN